MAAPRIAPPRHVHVHTLVCCVYNLALFHLVCVSVAERVRDKRARII